jgi:hypothetical protein
MRPAVLVGLLVLAACQAPSIEQAAFQAEAAYAEDACGAYRFQWLVARPVSDLQALRFDQPVRIVRPEPGVPLLVLPVSDGQPTGPGLTVATDSAGTITAVSCG